MSGAYSLEPVTHGKVILKTSFGDVEIELWPREAPRTVRNFLQHLLDGYYTGTIFHRIVPEFIIQGGDPTGTGYGGESVYDGGKPFPAELHQRLRFSHRGIVAMAGASKDDNRSQFFITLASCAELDRNHTIFGKVVGNTIFNVLEAGKLELSKDDPERPVHPPHILGAEIVVNPFEDMAPNPAAVAAIAARRTAESKPAEKSRPGRAGIARRNAALLSFADDDDEPPTQRIKFKMTAPPNFTKKRSRTVLAKEEKSIVAENEGKDVGKKTDDEKLSRKEEQTEEDEKKKSNKGRIFKLSMKEQKEETIYDFGPKETKRRKKINDDSVLEKLNRFKQSRGADDLKSHKLDFGSAAGGNSQE